MSSKSFKLNLYNIMLHQNTLVFVVYYEIMVQFLLVEFNHYFQCNSVV